LRLWASDFAGLSSSVFGNHLNEKINSYASNPVSQTFFSTCFRPLAWLNIAVQASFPLALAFTPAIAATTGQSALQPPASLFTQRTRVYTLKENETAATVAAKYGLTLQQLGALNQFRTFARGLNGLKPGDDVDVPAVTPADKPLFTARSAGDTSGSPDPHGWASAEHDSSNEQARRVAGYASQAGGFLAGSARSDTAASRARGMATNEAGGALQAWLSQFGTARVQLDADKNLSLKNSQFDLLMPLYDQGSDLVFAQGSLHRTDGRTQANLGTGLRYFTPTYMLGGNLFGDYDVSRDHARAGAGLEYWRDFLKLGFNGYKRLTNWKDSPDLADYQERPANGWDVRAQAWMPALPQLGIKLTYEQYYGREVALFGIDNRQKDPHAITAGINYTPVPLITLGGEQRQGQSGQNDTRFTVNMNYQLGVPWRRQVDPAAVAAMRSLAGSRYDLVERNNNIVLEYRKKEVIRLHTVDLITGKAGEQKSLGVSVTSTYGLARIDWDAPALIAAGGRIVQNGSDYAVVLPPYQLASQAVNTYSISGIAVDVKGNRSDRSETQVTVQAPEVNKQYSTFTPASSVLQAGGKGTQVLTLTLRDENNQVVDVDVQAISLTKNSLKSALVSAITKKSPGVYTVTVTAGNDIENVTLTPIVSGITLSSAVVAINDALPDAERSTFTANPASIAADNTVTSTLTLVAKDASDNALTGLKDNLTFLVTDSNGKTPASGVITESAITESSTRGTYTATLKGTVPGRYSVTPLFKGTALGNLSAIVTLTSAAPDQGKSAITTDATSYLSGAEMAVTVTLKDAQDIAVTGASSLLTTDTVVVANAVLKSGSGWKDNGNGTYTAIYMASTAGVNLRATLKLNGWSGSAESAPYAITLATPDQAKSAIRTDATTYLDGAEMTVTVTLRDAQGNAVTGAAASLTAEAVTVADATLKSGSSWRDNGDGTYTAIYRASRAGSGLKAVLKLSGWSGSAESPAYTITPATPAQTKSSIAVNNATYLAGADMTVTVTLRDEQNVAVTGASSLLTSEAVTVANAVLKSGSSWRDNGDGTYTATYIATTTGTGLKATVKLSSWSAGAESAAYSITAAAPDQAKSAIRTDATTYNAGADMTVTVTLKDAQDNAVTGAASLLTGGAVSVANAVLKSGSSWRDNGDGTYTATYIATTAGTGLKATVKLSSWSAGAESAVYSITAAAPDQTKSSIAVDNTTYVSGTEMTVTVTLKDAQDNAVTGAASLLSGGAVSVANAVLKSGSSWRDNGDGTYTATYIATTTGTGLKATVRLSSWSAGAESAVYSITAAAPDQAKSAIRTDATSYNAGADMTVTVTLKDAQDNAVTGAASLLTGSTVSVANAVLKSGSSWRDNGDGSYTATYTATTAGTGLRASLRLSSWSGSAESAPYDIVQQTEAPASINTQADSHTFTISGEEGTFPTTGFAGATFTIVPQNSVDASEYNWSSNVSWVSVTNGVVTFTGTGNGDKVVITGSPTNPQNKTIRYAFTLKSWYINDQSVQMTWDQANAYCQSQSGYSLPTVAQMSLNSGYVATQTRGIGALWNEWGNVTHYSGAGFFGSNYWSSEPDSSGGHYYIDLGAGYIHNDVGSVTDIVTCNRSL